MIQTLRGPNLVRSKPCMIQTLGNDFFLRQKSYINLNFYLSVLNPCNFRTQNSTVNFAIL